MSKIIWRYFFAWQEEKEKAFLENMAKDGYFLTETNTGKYIFNKSEPADVVYEIDFMGQDFEDVAEYLQIYEDAGWQMVADKGSWFYFCRERSKDMNNSLFNDNTSKLEKYRRLLGYMASLWLITVFFIFISISFSVRQEAALSSVTMTLLILSAFVIPGLFLVRIWLKYQQMKSKIKE